MKLKVKFENEICQDFEFVGEKSDWIDLKAARDYELKQFEYALIDLGFALQLPDGYEAHIPLSKISVYCRQTQWA